jgi:hypothetical protein
VSDVVMSCSVFWLISVLPSSHCSGVLSTTRLIRLASSSRVRSISVRRSVVLLRVLVDICLALQSLLRSIEHNSLNLLGEFF